MVGTCHYAVLHLSKPKASTTTRVNPNVNHGLWVIMMCQQGGFDSVVGCGYVGARVYGKFL